MSRSNKIGTIALIIDALKRPPQLVESLSDEKEIDTLEAALQSGEPDPLSVVYDYREMVEQEDQEFGDYVEELLTHPGVRQEIREHGLRWLKSKMKIEEFQRSEDEATAVIAQYAYRLFVEEPSRTDFLLAGPNAQVRVRIFKLNGQAATKSRAA